MGMLDLLRDFSNWSTVGGVPHIANARTWIVRLFWSIVVLFLMSIFIYQLYMMIKQFVSFPSTVNTDILVQAQTFPAVTICNLNPYKLSAANTFTADLTSFESYYEDVVNETPGLTDNYGLLNLPTTYDRDTRAKDAVAMISAKYSEADKGDALYTYDEMIADCTFNGVTCSSTDFTALVDPVFGRCFTYNNLVNSTLAVSRAGKTYGLRMLITVRQTGIDDTDNYFLATSSLAGVKVAVHSPGEYPNLEGTALTVGVGYTTAVAITTAQYNLAKKPYGDCVEKETNAWDYYSNYKYTSLTCFNGCRQKITNAVCGCYNPRYLGPTGATFCTPNATNVVCLDSLKGDQTNSTNKNIDPLTDCGCKPACAETTFALTTSLSHFPSDGYTVVADSENGTSSSVGSCTDDNSYFGGDNALCEEWYANNALQLQVYFETMRSEKYSQVSSYGLSSMINDLGGQAGLYLGLSIISCIECCGLIVMLFCYCCTCGRIAVKPYDDIEGDHRIRELDDLKRVLDEHDRLDTKEKRLASADLDSDDEPPKKTTAAAPPPPPPAVKVPAAKPAAPPAKPPPKKPVDSDDDSVNDSD